MLATALHPPAVVYREEQNFGWWIYVLLAVMAAAGLSVATWTSGQNGGFGPGHSPEVPVVMLVGLTLPGVLVVGVLHLTTEVDPSRVRIWFGWVPTFQRSIALVDIDRIEVVVYRPIRDYGGWGIRIGPGGEKVYNARGNRGVRLHLADGSRVLIGSQRPEDLALAIERAKRPEV